jgi:periplasmic copper chaperone A
MRHRIALQMVLLPALAFTAILSQPAPFAAYAQTSTALTIRDAWMRQPLGERKDAGVFATIENSGATTRTIVSAAADLADRAELHEMKMAAGMMRMSQVGQIEVPAHGHAELKPGGYHVMLFGLKKVPVAGDTFKLTLTFDDGSTVSATVSVRRDEGMKSDDKTRPKK